MKWSISFLAGISWIYVLLYGEENLRSQIPRLVHAQIILILELCSYINNISYESCCQVLGT
jgi:hypothetical protein